MTLKLQHKSFDRGLTIMEILAREGALSLADLHRRSGIPKSTIRRLLATLTARRLARQSFADKLYRLNVTFPVAAGEPLPADQAYVLDVALPLVSEMTRTIGWPSDIQLLEGERMRVLDSTRPLSPFHLYRGVVNRQLNIFGSATGMSCLAEMGDREFLRIAAHTAGDHRWGLERFRVPTKEYLSILRATRHRGYGIRLPGMAADNLLDDGLAAIARPIYAGSKLVGAVSLLWPKVYLSYEEFAGRYLSDLKSATDRIAELLAEGGAQDNL